MKHLTRVTMIGLMVILLISGCNKEGEKQFNVLKPIETKVDSNLNGNEKNKLLNEFKKIFPNATVYDSIMFDFDKDKIEELIVIFDLPDKKVNFAVLKEGKVNAISVGKGDKYSFKYVLESLKVLESPNRFIITAYDETQKFTVDFQITMEYDKVKNVTSIKIDSMNERRD